MFVWRGSNSGNDNDNVSTPGIFFSDLIVGSINHTSKCLIMKLVFSYHKLFYYLEKNYYQFKIVDEIIFDYYEVPKLIHLKPH